LRSIQAEHVDIDDIISTSKLLAHSLAATTVIWLTHCARHTPCCVTWVHEALHGLRAVLANTRTAGHVTFRCSFLANRIASTTIISLTHGASKACGGDTGVHQALYWLGSITAGAIAASTSAVDNIHLNDICGSWCRWCLANSIAATTVVGLTYSTTPTLCCAAGVHETSHRTQAIRAYVRTSSSSVGGVGSVGADGILVLQGKWLACCVAASTIVPHTHLRTVLDFAGVKEALHRLGTVTALAGRAHPGRSRNLLTHCLAATTIVSFTHLISHAGTCSSNTRVCEAVGWLGAIGACSWRAVGGCWGLAHGVAATTVV
jgi:hypothetical protein